MKGKPINIGSSLVDFANKKADEELRERGVIKTTCDECPVVPIMDQIIKCKSCGRSRALVNGLCDDCTIRKNGGIVFVKDNLTSEEDKALLFMSTEDACREQRRRFNEKFERSKLIGIKNKAEAFDWLDAHIQQLDIRIEDIIDNQYRGDTLLEAVQNAMNDRRWK